MSRELVLNSVYRKYLEGGKGFVRLATIKEDTGLSSQLTHYHMKNLEAEGLFKSIGGGIYTDFDINALSREIDSWGEKGLKRPTATKLITAERAAWLNAKIDLYFIMHRFLPKYVVEKQGQEEAEKLRLDATIIKKEILEDIDETIRHLKAVRKYASGSPTLMAKKRWKRLVYTKRPTANFLDAEFKPYHWKELFPELITDVLRGDLSMWEIFVQELRLEAGVHLSQSDEDNGDDAWEGGE